MTNETIDAPTPHAAEPPAPFGAESTTDEEMAAGYVLTCQSVPKGEGVEVDYDA